MNVNRGADDGVREFLVGHRSPQRRRERRELTGKRVPRTFRKLCVARRTFRREWHRRARIQNVGHQVLVGPGGVAQGVQRLSDARVVAFLPQCRQLLPLQLCNRFVDNQNINGRFPSVTKSFTPTMIFSFRSTAC